MHNSTEVEDIVRSTREMTLPHFGNISFTEKDQSGGNYITEIDKQVELYLKEQLHALDPTITFVGEEFGGNLDGEQYWLCDPIDGTDLYIRGLPFATTMLALVKDGDVIESYIYNFVEDVMYSAQKGRGAYKNVTPISVTKRPRKNAMICIETRDKKKFPFYIEHFHHLHIPVSGYKFAMLAQGSIDGSILFNGYAEAHDLAPGSLLVAEAGAKITNLDSASFNFRNLNYVCATTDELHHEISQTYETTAK